MLSQWYVGWVGQQSSWVRFPPDAKHFLTFLSEQKMVPEVALCLRLALMKHVALPQAS